MLTQFFKLRAFQKKFIQYILILIFALPQFLSDLSHIPTHLTSCSSSLSKKKKKRKEIKTNFPKTKIPQTKKVHKNCGVCFVLANYPCAWDWPAVWLIHPVSLH